MVTIQALTRPGTHVPVASIFLPGSRDWTGSEPGTVLTAECNQVTINMGYHMVSGDMVYGDMVFNKSKTTWIAMFLVHIAMPADFYFCQKRLLI